MNNLDRDYEKYTGAVIYALVGSDGVCYIGKSINYFNRMEQHYYAFNSISKGKETIEGNKLVKAIRSGIRFKAKILEKIPPEKNSHNYLCEREEFYFELYGGLDGTYNSTYPTAPNYWYQPYNEIGSK